MGSMAGSKGALIMDESNRMKLVKLRREYHKKCKKRLVKKVKSLKR